MNTLTLDALATAEWPIQVVAVANPRRVLSMTPFRGAREPELHVRTISSRPRLVDIIRPEREGGAERVGRYAMHEERREIGTDWLEVSDTYGCNKGNRRRDRRIALPSLPSDAEISVMSRLELITRLVSGGRSFADIGRIIGVSRERVRQIAGKAGIKSVRHWGIVT